MQKKRKGYAKALRKLQSDLEYWNMQLHLEQRWIRQTKEKIEDIEKKIERLTESITSK